MNLPTKSVFKAIRVMSLLAMLGGVFFLWQLSTDHDPRFYQFLHSAPGQFLNQIFSWEDVPKHRIPDTKAPWKMSDEERAVQRQLEAEQQVETASDKIIKTNGQELLGTILSKTEKSVVLQQNYGDNGSAEMHIPRANIQRIEKASLKIPEINYRDVRFKMEFPELNLYRRPPFTIMTSEKYFAVEKAIENLRQLHEQMHETFGELYTKEPQSNIQLLFFTKESHFQGYRKFHAAGIAYSVGFYSPNLDRLVMYNQSTSKQLAQAQSQLDKLSQNYRVQHRDRHQRADIEVWRKKESARLIQLAQNETIRTLRHEGAHQVFYASGIHSSYHNENLWLIEGLAVYCEGYNLGEHNPHNLEYLRGSAKRNTLIPWKTLVNFRSPAGFGDLVATQDTGLAYAQSWHLANTFMQPRYRERFFEFIKAVREHKGGPENQYQLLCETFGMPESRMEELLQSATTP